MEGEVLTDQEVRRERALKGIQNRKKRRPDIKLDEFELPAAGQKGRTTERRLQQVKEGLTYLDPKAQPMEDRIEALQEARVKYAPMKAHQEVSAMVLAAGGTFKMAAARAGVSVRQVKKYYQDPNYRARIEELRNTVFSKVKGRLVKELERRTRAGKIENIELLDLLRVFDRVYGPVGGARAGNSVEVNVVNQNADTIIAALLAPESETESADFPEYRPRELRLSDPGSPESG